MSVTQLFSGNSDFDSIVTRYNLRVAYGFFAEIPSEIHSVLIGRGGKTLQEVNNSLREELTRDNNKPFLTARFLENGVLIVSNDSFVAEQVATVYSQTYGTLHTKSLPLNEDIGYVLGRSWSNIHYIEDLAKWSYESMGLRPYIKCTIDESIERGLLLCSTSVQCIDMMSLYLQNIKPKDRTLTSS
tara:strand:- start:2307 stop:2864 length:558 start_codon:yes stop_codon:yes gene_type:complete